MVIYYATIPLRWQAIRRSNGKILCTNPMHWGLPLLVLCFSRAQSVTGRIMLQPIRPMVACKLVRIPIKHKYYAPLTATCSTIERTAACQRNEVLWQRSVSKDKTALRFRIFCHLRIGPTHITLFGDVIVQHGKRICRKRIRMFVRKADKISFFAATGQAFRSFAELPMAEIMDVGSSMRKIRKSHSHKS